MADHRQPGTGFYTRAVRFPKVVGKTPDGKRLAMGPYTITQVIVGGALLSVLWSGRGLWARFGAVNNVAAGVAALVAAVFLAGRLPYSGVNPLVLAAGFARQWLRPGGAVSAADGRPAAVPRPAAASGGARIAPLQAPPPGAPAQPPASQEGAVAPSPGSEPPSESPVRRILLAGKAAGV